MDKPKEHIIHCCSCNRYIQLPDTAQDGDIVTCPFCKGKNVVRLKTIFVGEPAEEA